MAVVKPFYGIRPERGSAADIAALPYDVYNRAEATEEVADKPHSFLRIDRAETGLPKEIDTYDDRVYERAHELLRQMIDEGLFVRDDKRCYYLYELTMNGRVQTGIVACASVDDYLSGTIKKHENTRTEKEEDRIRHVDRCSAQTGPIFLAYRANDRLKLIIDKTKENEPLYDFMSDDGIRHRVFMIDKDADIEEIEHIFGGIGSIYIADGHHRCASAVKVGLKRREQYPDYTGEEEFNYFLSVIFPDNELMIMDYNRLIKDLNGLTAGGLLDRVKERFEVSRIPDGEDPKPQKKGTFSMYLDSVWYSCSIRVGQVDEADPVASLDISVLQDTLLCPILGIDDPKTDPRIDFVGGIRGLEELERRCANDCAVAFAMYPTSISELFAVADAGLLMPPKSTWFEPKLRSGLFIHEIEPGI